MCKLHWVVVLYYPDETLIENINSYIDHIDFLYIIDNTPSAKWIELWKINSKSVHYISNNSNLWIAYALNIWCKIAQDKWCEYLLTMDQDSSFMNFFSEQSLTKFVSDSSISSLFCNYYNSKKKWLKFVKSWITSWSIIKLHTWEKVWGFNEEYFIDSVDEDFYLKSRKKWFKLLMDYDTKLKHNWGNRTYHKILWYTFFAMNYSNQRWYYILRNKINFIKNHFLFDPLLCIKDSIYLLQRIVYELIFSEWSIKKWKSMLLWIKHAFQWKYWKHLLSINN